MIRFSNTFYFSDRMQLFQRFIFQERRRSISSESCVGAPSLSKTSEAVKHIYSSRYQTRDSPLKFKVPVKHFPRYEHCISALQHYVPLSWRKFENGFLLCFRFTGNVPLKAHLRKASHLKEIVATKRPMGGAMKKKKQWMLLVDLKN